jgi:uncharacterized protein (DUF1778 family)
MQTTPKSKQAAKREKKTSMARSVGQVAIKRDRLHLRLDVASRHKIEQAAHYLKKTASEFVLSQSILAADKIIEAHGQAFALSSADWNKFCHTLENPPKPNRQLMAAAKRYARRGGELVE